jgi:hypothetical protein
MSHMLVSSHLSIIELCTHGHALVYTFYLQHMSVLLDYQFIAIHMGNRPLHVTLAR